MTQEEKRILASDICARLPYVIIHTWYNKPLDIKCTGIDLYTNTVNLDIPDDDNGKVYIDNCKPYLRPMSSMTEEEKENILQALNIHGDIDSEGNLLLGVECNILSLKVCKKYLGELNKRMFDVCHLIEKGLALGAPEGMYK